MQNFMPWRFHPDTDPELCEGEGKESAVAFGVKDGKVDFPVGEVTPGTPMNERPARFLTPVSSFSYRTGNCSDIARCMN